MAIDVGNLVVSGFLLVDFLSMEYVEVYFCVSVCSVSSVCVCVCVMWDSGSIMI